MLRCAAVRSAAVAVLLAGCISIPPFRGDAGGADTFAGPLNARFIANAYREGGPDSSGAYGTFGMSEAGYAVLTTGINDGDLVLLIANSDNGANNLFNVPAGFTQIVQREYGTDGQTYVIAYKIAGSTEPMQYTGTYNPQVSSSHAATVSLIAITGYNAANPIEALYPTDHQTPTDPADVSSAGIVTTANNSLLIYAAGADWTPSNGENAATVPSGYTLLTSIGDRDTHWDWTSQVIAKMPQAIAGSTGALSNTLTGISYSDHTTHIPGGGWNVLLAIAPAL
jgi:hypothetical protein